MVIKIVRVETHPYEGTFGVMTIDGSASFVTLEPYSRDNAKNISCIPPGQYVCRRYSSAKYPNTFEVTNIQNRTFVLFHKGNVDEDTAGCIIVGSEFGMLGSNKAVLESTKAFDKFMDILETYESFKLTIVEEF